MLLEPLCDNEPALWFAVPGWFPSDRIEFICRATGACSVRKYTSAWLPILVRFDEDREESNARSVSNQAKRFQVRKMRVFYCSLIVIAVFLSASLHAQEKVENQRPESVKPGINKSFLDPELDVDEWVNRFEVESREVFHARAEIVEKLDLKDGMRIGDVGAGTGAFVELFSKGVGKDGQVYAVDIVPKFVERFGKIADILDLKNVTPVLCGQDDVRLAPGSVDIVFVCDVYHHFEFPALTLASIHRALVPGGKFVVIDFERIPGKSREWTLGHVRAGKETFRKEIEAAGFEFVKEETISTFEENYFLTFKRK